MSDSVSAREIIERLEKQAGIKRKLAAEILRVIPQIIEEGLLRDGEVRVNGLGTFRLKWVLPRTGRNPKTGERIVLPAHNRLVFLPEQSFKEYINRDYRLLSYKIIPGAEVSGQQSAVSGQQSEVGGQQSAVSGQQSVRKRRIHWIIPTAISVIVILSLIFYFRNFYPVGSLRSAVSGQELTVDSERPVPTAQPEGTASDSGQSAVGGRQSAVSGQQSAVGGQQSAVSSQQSAVVSQQPKIDNRQSTIDNRQSVPPSQHIISAEGKHLFQLAREVYGNPYLWVLIYRENRDKIPDPDMLISGIDLIIPALDGTPEKLTRKDSLAVSDGYRLLYEYFGAKEDPRTDDFFKAMERYKPD